ncbi:MAG: hypothetical protein KDD94_06430 [Calditrichaeota bacterium]|nr:hypothetical protein [Calditrichota bacterium]
MRTLILLSFLLIACEQHQVTYRLDLRVPNLADSAYYNLYIVDMLALDSNTMEFGDTIAKKIYVRDSISSIEFIPNKTMEVQGIVDNYRKNGLRFDNYIDMRTYFNGKLIATYNDSVAHIETKKALVKKWD